MFFYIKLGEKKYKKYDLKMNGLIIIRACVVFSRVC